ncbi:hypothetical protein BVY01_03060 [bacterium I07]|nr:hypothetical protein BVY01_03060 [bacterium I07]
MAFNSIIYSSHEIIKASFLLHFCAETDKLRFSLSNRDHLMAKKNKKNKRSRIISDKRTAARPANDTLPELSQHQLLGLTLIVVCIYYGYSFLSNGFYQHDEAGHFVNMRTFWHDPKIILGIWAKPGYKLLFVIPSLLGPHFILFYNALIAGLTCFFTYKLCEKAGCKTPLFAFILLAFQPFWFQLAFRNYSETVSALILVLFLYMHYVDRKWIAALLLSYIVLTRQELYVFLGLYGLYLLLNKKFIPMLLLAVFPLLNHLWGWAVTGDPLFLYNQIFGTLETIQSAYPSMGFFHYFRMSLVIFGALALIYYLVYLGQLIFYKQRVEWFVFLAFTLFFLEYCVFQNKLIQIGPSGAGNLRYMNVVSPFIAILGAMALERLPDMKSRSKLLILLIPFSILALIYMRFKHNNLAYIPQDDYTPLLLVLIVVFSVFLLNKKRQILYFLIAASAVFTVLTLKPMQRSAEDRVMYEAVEWAKQNKSDSHPILASHTLFYYFWGKTRHDFPEGAAVIDQDAVNQAEIGTQIFWDSHYSYRPNLRSGQVPHTYFLERENEFRMLRQPFLSADRRFGLFVFEKIAVTDSMRLNE